MKFKVYVSLTVCFIIVSVIYKLDLVEDIRKTSLFTFSGHPVTYANSPNTQDQCPRKIIFQWNSYGRLGNQMLDYANVYVVAREMSGHLGLLNGARKYLENYFTNMGLQDISADCMVRKISKQSATQANSGARLKELYYSGLANASDVAKFSYHHDIVVFNLYDWVPILFPKYLSDLKSIFQFKHSIMEEALTTLHLVQRLYMDHEKPLLFIGIHVRRGDYEVYLQNNYDIPLLTPEFFTTGMKYFFNKYSKKYTVIYLAVSDDSPWVERNIQFPNLFVVSKNAAADMALLGLCNHTLTDYGTFGFWPSLFHGGEHYTTNAAPDYFVAAMNLMRNWTIIDITKPRRSKNHPADWIGPAFKV